jgi:hypothetical protein
VAAPEERDVIETLIRLVRVPQERAARVRAVIHARWRQELRRARRRYLLAISTVATATALIVTITLRCIEPWIR